MEIQFDPLTGECDDLCGRLYGRWWSFLFERGIKCM